MEEIWNIKSIRNNLLIIWFLTTSLLFISDNIQRINLFWIVEFEDINQPKILLIFFVLNLYVFYRYLQYMWRFNEHADKKFLLKSFLNSSYHTKNIISVEMNSNFTPDREYKSFKYKWEEIHHISYSNNLIQVSTEAYWTYFLFTNFLYDDLIYWRISKVTGDNNQSLKLYIKNSWVDSESLVINYEYKAIPYYLNLLKSILKDNYYTDYYFPILVGLVSIFFLTYKLIISLY